MTEKSLKEEGTPEEEIPKEEAKQASKEATEVASTKEEVPEEAEKPLTGWEKRKADAVKKTEAIIAKANKTANVKK